MNMSCQGNWLVKQVSFVLPVDDNEPWSASSHLDFKFLKEMGESIKKLKIKN